MVRTMSSGSVDLTKDPLHVSGDVPNPVEIRVAKGVDSGARLRGRVLDAVTGATPAADRMELCCFTTGPFERLSTAVLPDGSFDFSRVPPGLYTAELRRNSGLTAAGILNPTIEVGDQEKSGIFLVTATQLAAVTANVKFEGGSDILSSSTVKVALLISPGTLRGSNSPGGAQATDVISIPMGRLTDGTFWTPFPPGILYTLSVTNIPEGYRIKSITGPGGTSAVPNSAVDGGVTFSAFAPGEISIVLQR
jgi:hypothetical protein